MGTRLLATCVDTPLAQFLMVLEYHFILNEIVFLSESSNFENDITNFGLENKIAAIEKSINDFCEQNLNVKRIVHHLRENAWRYKKNMDHSY
jgi:hypothetical protein